MGLAAAFRQAQVDRRVSHALGTLHRSRRGMPRRRWLLLGFAVGLAAAMALLWSLRRERSRG